MSSGGKKRKTIFFVLSEKKVYKFKTRKEGFGGLECVLLKYCIHIIDTDSNKRASEHTVDILI